MKDKLWNKVNDILHERYGGTVPDIIKNRLMAERTELENTDVIVYLDFLSALVADAKKQGEHVLIRGTTGSLLVSYLLGATDVNPLPPHYYCPVCKSVEFVDIAQDGWDLPQKICSCGNEMIPDGHRIPFEVFRHDAQKRIKFNVLMSPEYADSARKLAKEYFRNCTSSAEKDRYSIELYSYEELTRYKKLEDATGICFDDVPFTSPEVLEEFQNANIEGIKKFESPNGLLKNVLRQIPPLSFHELIQISGMGHGTHTWCENGEKLVEKGYPIADLIAHRDDVFNYIQEKLLKKGLPDTELAYRVMEDARKGVYAEHGLPQDIRTKLEYIEADDWFMESICKTRYLFNKNLNISYVQTSATLMWYKIHYPKEFDEIIR